VTNSWTRAVSAARAGDLAVLESALVETPSLFTQRDADGDTLLGLACRGATGDIAIPPVAGTVEQHLAVDMLLSAGSDPNAATDEGWKPLHTAAMAGHVDLAKRLLAAGASREGRLYGADGGTPLSLALFYAKTEVAEVLAEPAVPDNLRSAAGLGRAIGPFVDGDDLTVSASAGTDFYRPLMAFPEWHRCKDRQEILDEALSWASRNGQIASMQALVDLGANVNANAYRGTALLWAVYGNRAGATLWLLEHGADPNLRHDFGGDGHGVDATAIHLAAQISSIDSLKVLLDHGADPMLRDGAHGGDALGWAKFSNAEDSVGILTERLA
jgi:ankyrin repeat protein